MAESKYTHKMVNGELIELTPEEVAECEAREQEAQSMPQPPGSEPPPEPKQERPDARSRPRR